MPAHSGPRRTDGLATRSPKLSAISPSSRSQRTVPVARVGVGRSPRRHRSARRVRRLRRLRPPSYPVRPGTSAPAGAAPSTAPSGHGRWPCRPGRRRPRPGAARRRRGPTSPRRRRRSAASGKAARHSHTARTATGWRRAPRQPAAAGAEHGPARLGVEGQTEQRVDQRQRRPRPPSSAPAAISTMSGTLGLSLAQRGRPQAVAAITRARRLRRVGEHPRPVLDVGAADVDLERGDAAAGRRRRRRGRQLRRSGVVRHAATPDADDHPRARRPQRGEVLGHPRRQPRTLQPDAVEHAGPDLVHPRRRVAGPRVDGQRLHDDRSRGHPAPRTRPARCRGPTSPRRS